MGQFKLFEEAGHSFVNHVDTITAGRLRQGAAEPGLSDPHGPVMIRLRLSAIHLPVSRLWNSALSRPRRAR